MACTVEFVNEFESLFKGYQYGVCTYMAIFNHVSLFIVVVLLFFHTLNATVPYIKLVFRSARNARNVRNVPNPRTAGGDIEEGASLVGREPVCIHYYKQS